MVKRAKGFGAWLKKNRDRVLIALGGAALAVITPLAAEGIRYWLSSDQRQQTELNTLFQSYDALGRVPEHVATCLDSFPDGDQCLTLRAETNKVYDFFVRLIREIKDRRLSQTALAASRRAELCGWTDRFGRIGRSSVAHYEYFNAQDQKRYSRMSEALIAVLKASPKPEDGSAFDNVLSEGNIIEPLHGLGCGEAVGR